MTSFVFNMHINMRISFIFIGLIYFGISSFSFAQRNPVVEGNQYLLESGIFKKSGMLDGYKLPKPPPEGDSYYVADWQKATLTTASGRVLEGYNAIYDISNHLFYIQLENKEIRVLDGKLIDNYSWINAITYVEEFFVNCLYYEIDGKNTAGFFRILYQDELELLVKRNIRIRKADYIEGLDTGRREDTILKEDAYFVAKSGIAYPLSGKIKNDQQILAAVFPGFDLKTHVKGHQIDLKTQEGMLQLITFLNDAF